MTNIQTVLASAPNPLLWNGYVHVAGEGQNTCFEYFNLLKNLQKVQIFLLNADGTALSQETLLSNSLAPRGFLKISARSLMKRAGLSEFRGQCAMIFENDSESDGKIVPAVTTHWVSSAYQCQVATQGIRYLNLGVSQRLKVFFMYCPVVVVNSEMSTALAIFNSSTDATYNDTVDLQPVLRRLDGENIAGKPIKIPPFGMAFLDVGTHFGPGTEEFLGPSGGNGSISISHIGHSFTSYFFHIDRRTSDIVSGQHTQPPAYVISQSKIWWGKLRRYAPWP